MRLSRSLFQAVALLGALTTHGASASSFSARQDSYHRSARSLSQRHHNSAQLYQRDASTHFADPDNDEGAAHGDIKAPDGSIFTSLKVGDDGDEMPAYWSDNPKNDSATHAYIMIHGKLRDGDKYWTTMNDILQKAIKDETPGADKNAIVVAPQFFSERFNSGQYTKNMLAFGDTNAWQAGEQAIHPSNTKQTAFDALDALVDEFMSSSKYPKMQNVTVVGHGGGAQLNQRYAMIASDASNPNVHIRYIHGDASSCAYFTKNRPQKIADSDEELPKRGDCRYYNTWRYGFDNFTGTAHGEKTPQDYFKQYITRDVVSIVGYQDVKTNGDTYCMARMQGGSKRRDRNLAWWQYINTLARTNEDIDNFPATFDDLPDWSDISNNQISVRLAVVEDAAHDAEEVFSGPIGRSTLFFKDVKRGWRPKGWKEAKAVQTTSSPSTTVPPASTLASSSSPSNNAVSDKEQLAQGKLTSSSIHSFSITSARQVTIASIVGILSTGLTFLLAA